MITILLADDDLLSLNRITGLTDFNSIGYEIIGQVKSGKECLKAVKQLKPDLLLLDIDMPDYNGVEVARILKESGSLVKILILSNYDDFAFVRDAMKYGASDYLLKHQITADVLKEKLNEIKKQIRQEGSETQRFSFLSKIAERECFRALLDQEAQEPGAGINEIPYQTELKKFSSSASVLAVMQITNFILVTHFSDQMNRQKLLDSILNLAENLFDSLKNGIVISRNYGQFAILFRYDPETGSQKIIMQTEAHMRLLASNIHKLFGLTALWQISDILHKPDRFCENFKLITDKLEKQPIKDLQKTKNSRQIQNVSETRSENRSEKGLENRAENRSEKGLENRSENRSETRVKIRQKEMSVLSLMAEKELLNALTDGEFQKVREILHSVLAPDDNTVGVISQPLLEQLIGIGVRYEAVLGQQSFAAADQELKRTNYSFMSSSQTLEFLETYFRKLISNSHPAGVTSSVHVSEAIRLIHRYYARDISLSMIAEELSITPTHLSHLFKSKMGISFIDYLTDYRIERAKSLLNGTKLELKEIAEQTGFNGYNYFLKVYKERTGETPSQTRERSHRHLNEGNSC